jgi:hypothetical protein
MTTPKTSAKQKKAQSVKTVERKNMKMKPNAQTKQMRKLQAAKRQTWIFRQGLFDKDKIKHHYMHDNRSRHLLWDGPKNRRPKNRPCKTIVRRGRQEIHRKSRKKRINTERLLQEAEEENKKLQATSEKLIRIRGKNVKLKQQIANMENEQKNLTAIANVHQQQTFTSTNFTDLDEFMSVDESTINQNQKRRTRNGPTENKKR